MQEQQFRAGEIIFREGEESDWAYLIVSGKVDIYKRMDNGTVLLATLGEGEIFGEMGILTDARRSASASANTLLTVKMISKDFFGTLAHGQPPEVVQVLRGLMERLREADAKLTQLANKQAQFQLSSYSAVPPINQVTLIPMSAIMKEQMAKGGLKISLPFRVGSIAPDAEPNPMDWNNLFIKADSAVVSRNHFGIQRGEAGLCVIDRGSKTGTLVNGVKIGGGSAQFKADLKPGENEVVAGDGDSPYRFVVLWE